MFNLFKKQIKEVITQVLEPEFTVEMIHEEIDTAQDRLLDQAKTILSTVVISDVTRTEEKAARLEAMGFVKTPDSERVIQIREQRTKDTSIVVASKDEAELIEYYKFNYPFMKFLTEIELERICSKYGLIFAPVKNYIKSVPDKNLTEMERAQALKPVDVSGDKCKFSFESNFSFDKHVKERFNNFLKAIGYPSGEITKEQFSKLLPPRSKYWVDQWNTSQTPCYVIWDDMLKKDASMSYNWNTCVKTDRSGLFIAAPPSHFDTKGLTQDKKGFFNVTKTEVKDPIVFRYVRGGVQVLTKWGTEDDQSANDPTLINEKMN